jgi:hypothetical protein
VVVSAATIAPDRWRIPVAEMVPGIVDQPLRFIEKRRALNEQEAIDNYLINDNQ